MESDLHFHFYVNRRPGNSSVIAPVPGDLIFPGSFNPLHRGHHRMASIANSKAKGQLWYELSQANTDKSDVSISQLDIRLIQDFRDFGMVISNAATFEQKSHIFPGTTFVVGADTIIRVADLKYYDQNPRTYAAAMDVIDGNDCRFLVFGRKIANNFVGEKNILLDDKLLGLCDFVLQDEFQDDISSTTIRES